MTSLLAVPGAAIVLTLGGCGSTLPSPSVPAVVGTVRLAAVRAADDNALFGAVPKGRLRTTDGRPATEWILSLDSVTAREVPVGQYTLSAFAVYLSDTIVCVDQASGAPGQTCLQPTTGMGLTCDLPIVVTEDAVIEATFQILADGRCRLDFGLPGG